MREHSIIKFNFVDPTRIKPEMSELSAGLIIGIIIGVLVIVILAAILLWVIEVKGCQFCKYNDLS